MLGEHLSTTFRQGLYLFCIFLLLFDMCGWHPIYSMIEENNTCYDFFLCNYNLISITAYNFSELPLLEAFKIKHELDMVFLSEAFLQFSIPFNDEKVTWKFCKLIVADNPSNSKKVCVSIKKNSSLFSSVKNLNDA